MKIKWTARARTRLAELHDYIAQDSKPRALAVVERILDRAETPVPFLACATRAVIAGSSRLCTIDLAQLSAGAGGKHRLGLVCELDLRAAVQLFRVALQSRCRVATAVARVGLLTMDTKHHFSLWYFVHVSLGLLATRSFLSGEKRQAPQHAAASIAA